MTPDRPALLEALAWGNVFGGRQEDFAVETLGHILSASEAARAALSEVVDAGGKGRVRGSLDPDRFPPLRRAEMRPDVPRRIPELQRLVDDADPAAGGATDRGAARMRAAVAPHRTGRPRDAGSDRGYAMAGLLAAIAVLGVLTSVALPAWRTLAQREKEAELLFRGGQYVRAIDLYQRRYPGAYPTDLDMLVEERFLRRLYLDPMTGEPFRVLTQGSAAAALGEAAGDAADDPAAGNGGGRRRGGGRLLDGRGRISFGGAGADRGPNSSGSTGRSVGRRTGAASRSTGAGRTGSSSGSTGAGRDRRTGSAFGSTGAGRGGSAFGSTGAGRGRRTGAGRGGFGSTGAGRGRRTESGAGSTFSRNAGGTGEELGAIVGVVSRSSERSLREYNGATRYDQWLFVHAAVPGAAGATAAGGRIGAGRGAGARPFGAAGRTQRPAGRAGDDAGRGRGRSRMRR